MKRKTVKKKKKEKFTINKMF